MEPKVVELTPKLQPKSKPLRQAGIIAAICSELSSQVPDIDLDNDNINAVIDAANLVVNKVDARKVR